MSQKTIFYSWQSDLPNRTNRGFIERALERACKKISSDPAIEPAPRLDKDTAGVPGAPDIAAVIFEKIDQSNVVVADISLVDRGSVARDLRTPNPNVLIELGYALNALGWKKLLLILNRAYGPPEDLPFDLKMRRPIIYDFPEDLKDSTVVLQQLQNQLERALREILSLEEESPQEEILNQAAFSFEGAGMNSQYAEINIMNHGNLASGIEFSLPTAIKTRMYPSNVLGNGKNGKLIMESETGQIKIQMPLTLQYSNIRGQRIIHEGTVDFNNPYRVILGPAQLMKEVRPEIDFLNGHMSLVQSQTLQLQLWLKLFIISKTSEPLVFPFHRCGAELQFLTESHHIEVFDEVEMRFTNASENSSGQIEIFGSAQIVFFARILDFRLQTPIPDVPLKGSALMVDLKKRVHRVEFRLRQIKPESGGELQRWKAEV